MRRFRGTAVAQGVVAGLVAIAAAGCGSGRESQAATPSATNVVQLAPENVTVAKTGEISSGPTISGQLTPARKATVRAQAGGTLVLLSVDRGEAVKAGAEIAKISSRDLEVNFESAGAAVKSAETALAVATSELTRTESLVKGGALAARDLEQAKNAHANAEAALAAARAHQRSAWQQLDDTSIKAPFGGIVSERPASIGDNVAPGTELLTIIDPSSMRLEASVPSDDIQQVRPGAKVHFSIRGAAGDFVGTVDRISPSADPITRQVSVFVSLPNVGGKLIAGLFAEGRIDISTRKGIVVPLSAVDETGPVPTVTRIRADKADRVAVQLGARRTDTETVEVTGGIADGDVLITGSAKGVAAGTPVKVIQ
jgi:RND family efflux transporter MFP subunit